MKFICIGRNYAAHAEELNNAVPSEPLIFMKPATALLPDGRAFFIPDFSNEIHYEGELVLRIGKNGKAIQEKFAESYISHITVGIDFTARDLQEQLKKKSYPWEIAKAFDGSAALGEWVPYSEYVGNPIKYTFSKNGTVVQDGDTSLLLFSFATIISYVSQFFTLNQGDCIFTGTPAGVGVIKAGDHYEGSLGSIKVLTCQIR